MVAMLTSRSDKKRNHWMEVKKKLTLYLPWESKTKQRMVFRMIHVKDSLLPRGKVWSLDFLGLYISFEEFFQEVPLMCQAN